MKMSNIFTEDRYQQTVAKASEMEFPPRICIVRRDATEENAAWIEDAGISVKRIWEYHLIDSRLKAHGASYHDAFHYSEILGYEADEIEIFDNEKWEKAIADEREEYTDENGDRPWNYVEDGLREGMYPDPSAPVSTFSEVPPSQKVFVLWDFKDNSSDDPDWYNGTHQYELYKQALEYDETLEESLTELLELIQEEISANGFFLDMEGMFPKEWSWEEEASPQETPALESAEQLAGELIATCEGE